MYTIAQKRVKSLGDFMQQVHIKMKTIVNLGLHLFNTVSDQLC